MKTFSENLKIYFESTTLHGFAYIASSKKLIEKIFWIIALLTSSICCMRLIFELFQKVENNPVIVYRPDIAVPIKEIPFPAVSVCPFPMIDNTYGIFSSLLKTNNASYPFVINICTGRYDCPKIDYHWTNYYLYMQQRVNTRGIWMTKTTLKSELMISRYGWCDTFNRLEYKQIYHKNKTPEYFDHLEAFHTSYVAYQEPPYFTSNKKLGFELSFSQDLNHYAQGVCTVNGVSICRVTNRQSRVAVYSAYETLDLRHRSFVINYREILKIMIAPQIKVTDETLLDLPVDERRCYKAGEKGLKYFTTYTSINCLKECEAAYVLEKCGCVPYYFINNDTKVVCDVGSLDCCEEEHVVFLNNIEATCKCYPPCNEITYEIVVKRFSGKFGSYKRESTQTAEVHVYFKENSVYPQIRRKYFTMIDWFSFVGGILGLFFGFSFLSAFEVMYHIFKGFLGYEQKKRKFLAKKSKLEDILNKIPGYMGSWMKFFKDFLGNSSIHGFSYIGDGNLMVHQRISWIITFILSITACTYMIKELQEKWQINSISFVTGEGSTINMTEIPFPAVTLVGGYSLKTMDEIAYALGIIDNLRDISRTYDYFMDNNFQLHYIISNLVANAAFDAMTMMYTRPGRGFNFPWNITNYGHLLKQTVCDYSEISFLEIINATWMQDIAIPTATIFTYKGYGFSFNLIDAWMMMNYENISVDFQYIYKGYFFGGSNIKPPNFPWKPIYTTHDILTIEYPNFGKFSPKVYLHSPFEYPFQTQLETEQLFELDDKKTLEVLIVPEITTTDASLVQLSAEDRLCFMDGERKLKFFKIYTKRNCEIECLSDKLLSICGCVPYDIIRERDTRVCELFDYICVERIKHEMQIEEDPHKLCDCMDQCNFIAYNFEFFETKHRSLSNKGILKFKFKEQEFVAMQRVQQFTVVDFLSYIGGLLGLFAGISVLSLFELIYFFTLRLVYEVFKPTNKIETLDF